MEKIIYRRSFEARLILFKDNIIDYYQSVKDSCSMHEGIKFRVSFNHESVTYNKVRIAMIKSSKKYIELRMKLNPKKYTTKMVENISQKDEKLPLSIKIHNEKSFKKALELLEDLFESVGALALKPIEEVDYKDVYYDRSLTQMLKENLVKKYVKVLDDDANEAPNLKEETDEDADQEESDNDFMFSVTVTAKLLFDAVDKADELFIVTNTFQWDPSKAIKMERINDNLFKATFLLHKGTKLEFKICRSQSFEDVEKGIWKEEIVNHKYFIVDKDLDIEDLIYNFNEID